MPFGHSVLWLRSPFQPVRGVRRLPRLPDRNAPTRACWAERQRAGTCRQHFFRRKQQAHSTSDVGTYTFKLSSKTPSTTETVKARYTFIASSSEMSADKGYARLRLPRCPSVVLRGSPACSEIALAELDPAMA